MCREYARCLRTLLQAPVEHQCVTVGSKEIVQSHVEVMAMQLQRELFFFSPLALLLFCYLSLSKGSGMSSDFVLAFVLQNSKLSNSC